MNKFHEWLYANRLAHPETALIVLLHFSAHTVPVCSLGPAVTLSLNDLERDLHIPEPLAGVTQTYVIPSL